MSCETFTTRLRRNGHRPNRRSQEKTSDENQREQKQQLQSPNTTTHATPEKPTAGAGTGVCDTNSSSHTEIKRESTQWNKELTAEPCSIAVVVQTELYYDVGVSKMDTIVSR